MTDKQRAKLLSHVNAGIANIAVHCVRLHLRNGDYHLAIEAVEDAQREYQEVMAGIDCKSTNVPLEYLGIDKRILRILRNKDIETVQELLDIWPCGVLAVEGIGPHAHMDLYRALLHFGYLMPPSQPSSPQTNDALLAPLVPLANSATP